MSETLTEKWFSTCTESRPPSWRHSSSGAALTEDDFDENPWPPDREEVTFEIQQATAASGWFKPTLERLQTLLALPANWNGYGERRIHAASAKRLVALLEQLQYEGPPPTVVPLSSGGLQLEWQGPGDVGLEVEVPPDGPAIACFFQEGEVDEWSISAQRGVQRLANRVGRLLDR